LKLAVTTMSPRSTARRRHRRPRRLWLVCAAGLAALLLTTACGASPEAGTDTRSGTTTVDAVTIEVHRSAYCGCCGVYEDYLAEQGFEVEPRVREDVDRLKDSLGLPMQLASCHTSMVGGYFVEGHVPAEVIRMLLDERPDIDGIALAGMPAGSPGMPGQKDRDWVIYAISDGEATEFTVL
jgi:hypothetical protein